MVKLFTPVSLSVTLRYIVMSPSVGTSAMINSVGLCNCGTSGSAGWLWALSVYGSYSEASFILERKAPEAIMKGHWKSRVLPCICRWMWADIACPRMHSLVCIYYELLTTEQQIGAEYSDPRIHNSMFPNRNLFDCWHGTTCGKFHIWSPMTGHRQNAVVMKALYKFTWHKFDV